MLNTQLEMEQKPNDKNASFAMPRQPRSYTNQYKDLSSRSRNSLSNSRSQHQFRERKDQ